jgi:hypothetical protein
MPMPERFAIETGLRVLVTAGAAGIGQAIASMFAEAGARVHICDISQGVLDECPAASSDISGTLADVSDEHDVGRFLPTCIGNSPGSMCLSTMPALPDPPRVFTRFRLDGGVPLGRRRSIRNSKRVSLSAQGLSTNSMSRKVLRNKPSRLFSRP